MAMGNSLGLNPEAGKNMAMNLTGLVGDIASFYNISVEQANTAISAIYTGETESIKKLGIVLTEANLNAYAVSQGIQKTYNQMTQAEKVMLRYNYVMQASSKIQGDFARTSGNWANQVRVLKEQWSQLLSILGKGLIAVLNPIVKTMNTLLASVISVANAFSKAFGGQGIQKTTSSVSSSVGEITSGIEDTAGGFDQANNSAKKLKNTLAGFDELNVLSKADSGAGSTGGSTSGSIEGIGDIVASEPQETPASKLSGYLQECKDILDKWAKTIPKLEINFDKEKAIENLQNIGKNVLNTIAGWGSFVISIAIQVANDLDIGALANSFLNLVDSATRLASAITESVIPAINRFYEESGLQKLVQWIGQKFKDGLDGLAGKLDEWAQWFEDNKDTIEDFGGRLGGAVEPLTEIVIKIGDTAWNIFVGTLGIINDLVMSIADTLIRMDVDQLRTLMLTLAGLGAVFGATDIGLQMIGTSFGKVAKEGKGFGEFFLAIKEGLLNFGDLIGATIKKFDGIILAIPTKIGGALGSIKGFFTQYLDPEVLFSGSNWDKLSNIVYNMLSPVGTAIKDFITGIGPNLQALGLQIKSAFDVLATTISEKGVLGTAFTGLKAMLNTVKGGFKALWTVAKAHPFVAIVAVVATVIASLTTLYNNSEEFRNFVNELWSNLKEIFSGVKDAVKDLWDNHLKPLWEDSLKPLFKSLGDVFSGLWDTISTVIGWVVGILGGTLLTAFTSTFGSILETVITVIGGVSDALNGILTFISGVFSGNWKKAWEGIKLAFKGVWDALTGIAKAPLNMIIGFINGALKAITSGVNTVIRNINKLSWKVPDWVPLIGGQQWGFHFSTLNAPQIPLLANGGVIEQPTVAMMGEYTGASNNPEIVAPQKLLTQIFNTQIEQLIPVLVEQTTRTIQAIENIDMEVKIGDEAIAKSAQRGNKSHIMRTGQPIFSY